MLQISKRSWHYRWIMLIGSADPDKCRLFPGWWRKSGIHKSKFEPPKNLCAYFWVLVGFTVFLPFLSLMVGLWAVPLWAGTLAVTLVKWILVTPIVFMILLLIDLVKKLRLEKKEKPDHLSLTWELIKAKKRKACPLIEYKDE
ncbi:hypothetical protein LCGC14_0369700 [marine sediment metagenome]|uniref:Uncharacterized protein n=1 Tax=marine sediment metagenome TaxID=412755 RepID=A0A0F9VSM8_9ZZZZ